MNATQANDASALIELSIDGMSCGHCVATITQGLTELDGVAEATVNLAGKSAAVRPDGTVPDAELQAALRSTIAELGYQVVA